MMTSSKEAKTLAEALSKSDDRPRDRPRGAPASATYHVVSAFFLGALVPDIAAMLYGAFISNFTFVVNVSVVVFVVEIAYLVPMAILTGQGKLIGVRLLNIVGYSSIVGFFIEIVSFLALSVLTFSHSPFPAQAGTALIVAAVFLAGGSPLVVLVWNGLRHIRWLDPKSLPHEWELSTRSDPNSPMFCNQPLDPAQEVVRKWNEDHGLAIPTVKFRNPYPAMTSMTSVPTIFWAVVAPWFVQYRLGQIWMAALAGLLCLATFFFLLVTPMVAPIFWILAVGPAITAVKLARNYWKIVAISPVIHTRGGRRKPM